MKFEELVQFDLEVSRTKFEPCWTSQRRDRGPQSAGSFTKKMRFFASSAARMSHGKYETRVSMSSQIQDHRQLDSIPVVFYQHIEQLQIGVFYANLSFFSNITQFGIHHDKKGRSVERMVITYLMKTLPSNTVLPIFHDQDCQFEVFTQVKSQRVHT